MVKHLTARSTLALATVLAGSLGFSAAAQATTFYLGNGIDFPEVDDSFSYIEDGIGLTTTAMLNNGNDRNVYRSLLGSGATNRVLSKDSNQIDGIGSDETFILTFDQTVNLLSVTFSRVGRNDEFKLLVDGDEFIAADIPGGNFADLDISDFIFDPSPQGREFGFTVKNKNDDYLVKYVEVSAVPEPLTILGAGTALGFGGFFKKKLASQKDNKKA